MHFRAQILSAWGLFSSPLFLFVIIRWVFAQVCDLYCGKVPDEEKWDEARIGHYIGIGKSVYLFSCLGFL